ncbi:mucin-3A-like [Ylistrum balloti]|uniref:mucin-3A-like n=1 Tax=Ylistrum balloti TaxID=509963 RepID=UPI002905CA3A|nr:mucin-3A-like [Ylistrum balloti]
MTLTLCALFLLLSIHGAWVSCQCDNSPRVIHFTLFETRSFPSPGYPVNYGNNLSCVWIFEPDNAMDYFLIRLKDVNVDCRGDMIQITTYQSDIDKIQFCGYATTSYTYRRPGRQEVTFITDDTQKSRDTGFRIEVTSIPNGKTGFTVCPEKEEIELEAETYAKALTSPNYPEKYPSKQTCRWRILSKAGYKIRIVIKLVDIEYGFTHSLHPVDYLQIYYVTDHPVPPKRYSGRWNFEPVKDNVIISTGDVDLTFVTDSDTSYSGFILYYELVGLMAESLTSTKIPTSITELASTFETETTENPASITELASTFETETTENPAFTSELANKSASTVASGTTEDSVSTSEFGTTKNLASTLESSATENTASTLDYETTATPETTSEYATTNNQEIILSTAVDVSITQSAMPTSVDLTSTLKQTVPSDDGMHTTEVNISTTEGMIPLRGDVSSTSYDRITTKVTPVTSVGNRLNKNYSEITETQVSDVWDIHVSPNGTKPGVKTNTENDIESTGPVLPQYVTEKQVEGQTNSCKLLTCVVPVLVSILLLLSVLCVVAAALCVTQTRKRDMYQMRERI